jgi:FtsZ-binding cell division protein ZapB
MKLTMPRLNNEEIESIKFLVNRYSELWNMNNLYTQKLDNLIAERESLINEIEYLDREISSVKEQEKVLQENLKSKYGDFDIDMETFEIFIKE